MKTLSTCAVVAWVAALSLSDAQDTPASRLELATNHLKALTARMSAASLNDVHSLADWTRQKEQRRRELRYMLGLEPLPSRTPLHVQITGRLERPAYHIEKLVFQSLPGLYVTGNFYLPKNAGDTGAAGPQPTVLYLCGHSPHLLGAKVPYQDRAIWFASHGYPCLVLDTLEFGEVAGIHHGTHDLNMWHWLSLGYTPAGVEVWSAMRAIDYLETRREVDPKHIGLTGISGGGAMTWYTTAVDERVAAAAPVCSTFTHGSQAEHWLASGQCDCIYYYNTFRWDFPVVAALIAPRPLLILSGQKDTIFPPDGYHDVYQRARRVYDLYAGGKSERIREVDDNVAHSDPPLFLQEARQWMARWLRNDPAPVPLETSGAPPLEKGEDLACLARIPADALNFKIQHILTKPVSLSKAPSRASWEQRRNELSRQLKEKVFGWFPTEPVPFAVRKTRATGGWAARYADFKEVLFDTESGVPIRAQLFTPKETNAQAPLLIQLKRPSDSISGMDVDELLPVLRRGPVLVLFPRFTELPLSPSAFTDIERTAVWTGRTIAAMQIWDVLRAVDWALRDEKMGARPISLYGKGTMGVVALYAALLDPRVTDVILNDAPGSHWHGPALLNTLRFTDVAEVAAALAPRRLLSLTPFPASFDFTRAVYRRSGAAGQMQEAASLPEAVALAEGK